MTARNRLGGGVLPDVRTLFDSGTTVGLSDGELLGRFADRPHGVADDAAGPAFAALVERHGPMVLRVCRGVLRDEHDAQDAFQSTFLVLVKSAGAVRRCESVASWLHGVALRVSARARVELTRRRRHERRVVEGRQTLGRPGGGETEFAPELAVVLDEELARLPEPYRAAIVLCYLEGQTCEAAAQRLGWPVGTVKSRLARGRERLRRRLTRRGLAPDERSDRPTATAVIVPAELAQATIAAMRAIAGCRPMAVGSTVISWTDQTLRTLLMRQIIFFSAVMFAGLAAAAGAAAVWMAREASTATPRQAAAGSPAPVRRPDAPADDEKKRTEVVTVRVVDARGRGVAGVEVEVLERFLDDGGPRYRTGADGRVRVPLDPDADPSFGTRFVARPDDRTFGWGYLDRPRERKPGAANAVGDAVQILLLPRNHAVEGSVVDRAGRGIPGVRMHVASVQRGDGSTLIDYRFGPGDSRIGMAVTDAAGRYAIPLPEGSSARLVALHPRHAGPPIACGADQRTIPPVALEQAGGIVGTVVDATTGGPVAGARLHAGRLGEYDSPLIGDGWTTTDGLGRYGIGGLPPGVYNVYLSASPRGKRSPARTIEGVRVEAGAEAPADLKLVAGRRIHGTVVHAATGQPMVGVDVLCSNPALPSSGHEGELAVTDDQGRFAFFVPPGLSCVYIRESSLFAIKGQGTRTLIVADDRDPDPVRLVGGHKPDDPSARPTFAPGCQARFRVKRAADRDAAKNEEAFLIGRIVDQDGKPIPAVQVTSNFAGRGITCATDRLGVFRAKGLPHQEYLMDLTRKGYRPTTAHMPPEARDVEITLERLPDTSY